MLLFVEIKIDAMPIRVERMLMLKLDTKRPGQDWRDVALKLGICVSELAIVRQQESPTSCIFQILSSRRKVVLLRTFVAATHMLGRHDICDAIYEFFKSGDSITSCAKGRQHVSLFQQQKCKG